MHLSTCINSYNHLHNQDTEQFYSPKCSLFYLSIVIPSPQTQTPANTDLFSITTVLSLRECHKENHRVWNLLKLAPFTQHKAF